MKSLSSKNSKISKRRKSTHQLSSYNDNNLMGGQLFNKNTIKNLPEVNINALVLKPNKHTRSLLSNKKKDLVMNSHKSKGNNIPTLLLVEDNVLNRIVTKLYLKEYYEVDETDNGQTAISMTSDKHYDIILMDINLGPSIDGIETMQTIKENPDYKQTPFIAVTAYSMLGDKERFLSAGFDDYIPKPFKKDLFISTIEKSLITEKSI